MNYNKWLFKNTKSLKGKTVAITGSTGGIGVHICEFLAKLGADLILLNRSFEKTNYQIEKLKSEYGVNAKFISLDLSDMQSVKAATDFLCENCPDYLIHNAGAYSIPRYITDNDIDNVFQINFFAPYYITRRLLPFLSQKGGRVVAVGSVAHNYSKTNPKNFDFRDVKAASKVYGNAKRYLMLSLYELFEKEKGATLSVTHPGITFTNITAHYPKLIFAVIKHPMKVIFMKPKKAALSLVQGLFCKTEFSTWWGPRIFNVWGLPNEKRLSTFKKRESETVFETAEKLYENFSILDRLP